MEMEGRRGNDRFHHHRGGRMERPPPPGKSRVQHHRAGRPSPTFGRARGLGRKEGGKWEKSDALRNGRVWFGRNTAALFSAKCRVTSITSLATDLGGIWTIWDARTGRVGRDATTHVRRVRVYTVPRPCRRRGGKPEAGGGHLDDRVRRPQMHF